MNSNGYTLGELVAVLGALCVIGAIGFVAIHFIIKFW